MQFKTIQVILDSAEQAERISAYACAVARRFGAHLAGVHALRPLRVHPGVPTNLSSELVKTYREGQLAAAENIKQVFLDTARGEDFVSEWRLLPDDRLGMGHALTEQARSADLVIAMQPDEKHDVSDALERVQDLIKGSGRPVLVVPHSGEFEEPGKHLLIGWSATREATRAAHDALGFVGEDTEVTLLWVAPDGRDHNQLAASARDLAVAIDRHGGQVTVDQHARSNLPVGDVLLNEAFERGADMIVTGAYGHSRFYDFVVGATTSHLMRHMTVPVLFSR